MSQYLRDPWNFQHIVEFLSPSFHHPAAIFFEWMLALSVIASMWSIQKGRYTDAILMMVWAHGGLLAARNIPIFMIAAAPPVAFAIQQWLNALPEGGSPNMDISPVTLCGTLPSSMDLPQHGMKRQAR